MRKPVFLAVLVFIVFRAWLLSGGIITAGDLGFHFEQNLNQLFSLPYAWDGFWSPGTIGHYRAPFLFSYLPHLLYGFFSKLGAGFVLIERIVWLFPFLALSFFSSWYLVKTLFPQNKFSFLAPLVFLFNTYIFMIVGGGQMGLALAYAIAPLLFSLFVLSIRKQTLKYKLLSGLLLGLSVSFDPRIALVTMGVVGLYFVFSIKYLVSRENNIVRTSFSMFSAITVPMVIAVLLHFYWLLPLVFVRRAALPPGLSEPGWVEFLSFADFSNSLSLLHPNWPENIFGKTYFMRPEFLVIPFLAFSSLLFFDRLKNLQAKRNVLFFSGLAILGAFLAKGSKPPFGEIYLWLFKNFPGMNFFRDPTKFYLLVALSYSILIPFSLAQISRRLGKVSSIKYLVLSIFAFYLLFLIRPAWLGQLGGTFKARALPQEYVVLKDFINNQDEFFRTFWLPKKQRFGFRDARHPAVNAEKLPSREDLALMGVKYVIVPYDSEGEIFLEDRQYSHQKRLELEEKLDDVTWLKKIEVADKIAVYETPGYKDHFWTERVRPLLKEELGQGLTLVWQMVNPTKYRVHVQNASQPFKLVFSETYDELWQAKIGERIVPSTAYNDINSFTMEQTGDFEIMVEFTAQKYVYWGLVVSAATLLAVFGALAYLWRKR